MWGKHDDIRGQFKKCVTAIEKTSVDDIRSQVDGLITQLRNMAFMEEKILFPTALKKLDDSDWAGIRGFEGEKRPLDCDDGQNRQAEPVV